jgi:hypothetical protein
MPLPGGRFYDGDPVTAPFSDGHPQIGRRLTGRKQALEALGVYHLVADLRVPGQLAKEKERRTQRILEVRSRLVDDRLDHLELRKLINRHEKKDGSRQRELFIAIVWALAVIRGRIETAPARIEGEQVLADLGRHKSRLERSFDAIVRAIGLIDGSASEFHAQRHDEILPLLPSIAFSDDVDKIRALLKAAAEYRFYSPLYGTGGHVSEDPRRDSATSSRPAWATSPSSPRACSTVNATMQSPGSPRSDSAGSLASEARKAGTGLSATSRLDTGVTKRL